MESLKSLRNYCAPIPFYVPSETWFIAPIPLNVPSEIWFIMSPDEWIFWGNTVKCHYNACHYNANASLTRSILGSQTKPSWPSQSGSAHGLKVWNHRCLIGYSGNETPLFSYKWNKTKVSHLLVMSIQSIHYWSSIKHTDYSSPVLRECHHQANMAARCPDVENNPDSNQVNIRYTQ